VTYILIRHGHLLRLILYANSKWLLW